MAVVAKHQRMNLRSRRPGTLFCTLTASNQASGPWARTASSHITRSTLGVPSVSTIFLAWKSLPINRWQLTLKRSPSCRNPTKRPTIVYFKTSKSHSGTNLTPNGSHFLAKPSWTTCMCKLSIRSRMSYERHHPKKQTNLQFYQNGSSTAMSKPKALFWKSSKTTGVLIFKPWTH